MTILKGTPRYLQFGCGYCAPVGWSNFDASPRLWLQRIPILGLLLKGLFLRLLRLPQFPENVQFGDIAKGLPAPAGAFEAVYCSHVLEHLSLVEFRQALRNVNSHLRCGGRYRLVVPD